MAAFGAIGLAYPTRPLLDSPLGQERSPEPPTVSSVAPSAGAFGRSGAVQVQFALPGGPVHYPLRLQGDPTSLAYAWERLADSLAPQDQQALASDTLTAPSEPGFYRLTLVRSGMRQVVDGVTLAVLVPFEEKKGASLNGYRIGTYLAERSGLPDRERPKGFVQVIPEVADLQLTRHLRLGDFLTQDGQTTWPRYAAVSSRLLDKLELVVSEVASWRDGGSQALDVRVQSAYRTPWHNRGVWRAAVDSRHQYGDAVDVAIDANGDGWITREDSRLVELAVEIVESRFPDLAGGLGLYAGDRFRHPYVHIDARGTRVRWRA